MIISKGDLRKFLNDYPFMALRPTKGNHLVFRGDFQFIAKSKNGPEIKDSFEVKIEIPNGFPKKIPKVWETNNKVPRTKEGEFHINPDDSLCLGSPLRLLDKINRKGTLVAFIESCLVPFLYAVSIKLQKGGDFYMGELAHGLPGILDDYKELFGIESNENIIKTLELIGTKKESQIRPHALVLAERDLENANFVLLPIVCEKRLQEVGSKITLKTLPS